MHVVNQLNLSTSKLLFEKKTNKILLTRLSVYFLKLRKTNGRYEANLIALHAQKWDSWMWRSESTSLMLCVLNRDKYNK